MMALGSTLVFLLSSCATEGVAPDFAGVDPEVVARHGGRLPFGKPPCWSAAWHSWHFDGECDDGLSGGSDGDDDDVSDDGSDDDGDDDEPAVEVCNAVDDDGDGDTDEGCEDACASDDTCVSLWQAHALGGLTVVSSPSGIAITIFNDTDQDLCLDGTALFTSFTSQSFLMDPVLVDEERVLAPGEGVTMYYGSYTTANGYYSPYLGEAAWWCYQTSQSTAAAATYRFYGEEVPSDMLEFFAADADTDGDGRADRADWASSAVLAQQNAWNMQAAGSVLTVGKVAEADDGEVEVTLTVRNIGVVDGSGVVTDTVPSGWTLGDVDPTPSMTSANPDGTVTLQWSVSVEGYTTASTTGTHSETLRYSMVRSIPVDKVYLELDPAAIDFHDGTDYETNVSLPAAVYDYDYDGDGDVECSSD